MTLPVGLCGLGRRLPLGARAALVAGLACILNVLPALSPAVAQERQLTAVDLVGEAVDVGPKHQDIDEAIKAFVKREVRGARDLLENAKKKDPQLPPVDVMLAELYYRAQNPQAARAVLENVIKDDPSDPEPYLFFAQQAFISGRFTDAYVLFAKGAEVNEKYTGNDKRKSEMESRARGGMASVSQRRDDWDDVKKQTMLWIQADPDSSMAHARLGEALFMMADSPREYDEAYKEFQKSHEKTKNPDPAHPAITMALLHERKGNRTEAQKLIEQAIKQDPKSVPTRLAAARWMVLNEQYPQAKAQLAEVMKLDNRSVNGLILSGVVDRLTGDTDAAMKDFREALAISVTDFDATNQLALMLADDPGKQQQQQGLAYAEMNAKTHERGRNSTQALVTLGWIYYKLGREAESKEVLSKVSRRTDYSADSRYFLAKMLYDRGQSKRCAALLKSALDLKQQIFVYRKQALELLRKAGGAPDEKSDG